MINVLHVGRAIPRILGTAGLLVGVRKVLELLLIWQDRADERHQLAALDDRLLTDIGLTREQAARETRKPFWRA